MNLKTRTGIIETWLPFVAIAALSAATASLVTWNLLRSNNPDTNEEDADDNNQHDTSSSVNTVKYSEHAPICSNNTQQPQQNNVADDGTIQPMTNNTNKAESKDLCKRKKKQGTRPNSKFFTEIQKSTDSTNNSPNKKKEIQNSNVNNNVNLASNNPPHKNSMQQQPDANNSTNTDIDVNKSGEISKEFAASSSHVLQPSHLYASPEIKSFDNNNNALELVPTTEQIPFSWVVFWDIENVTKPHNMPVWKFVRAIRTYVSTIRNKTAINDDNCMGNNNNKKKKNQVKNDNNIISNEKPLQAEAKPSTIEDSILHITVVTNVFRLSGDLRAELHSNGVTVMHVQSSTRKDVADKALLTDICLLPHHMPPPLGIALLSGDVDYSYAISKLTHLGYFTLVIAPEKSYSPLLASAPRVVAPLSDLVNQASAMTIKGGDFAVVVQKRLAKSRKNAKSRMVNDDLTEFETLHNVTDDEDLLFKGNDASLQHYEQHQNDGVVVLNDHNHKNRNNNNNGINNNNNSSKGRRQFNRKRKNIRDADPRAGAVGVGRSMFPWHFETGGAYKMIAAVFLSAGISMMIITIIKVLYECRDSFTSVQVG